MTKQPFGLSAALVTAFDDVNRVDAEAMVRHAAWCLGQGCGSVTLFGTTGEGASISAPERSAVLSAFAAGGIAPSSVIGCVMANAAGDAIAQASELLRWGARGVLLAPPSYFKGVSDDGIFGWFAEVLSGLGASARGIILYNIPSVTAVELSVSLIGRLRAAFPDAIVGVKDSSGNWSYTERLLAEHKDIAILIGDERSLAAGVRQGAEGAISGMANVFPDRLLSLVRQGQGDAGVDELVNAVLAHPVTPAVKALVAHRTGDPAWARVRSPLVPTPEAARSGLGALLDRLGAAKAA
ncbi:dihydrodipicolinate synthase family protein [Aureimonas sp. ME7]|uniref:dihydrodipicolinate synthase family protein n=1 Tax=Aureimonas sp. ME7 TaxID=2744252 RepID=UPI0015F39C30|nr:dihydrodipicolinate synthase family protein [Aureimonas sp. ME7]